MTTATKTKKITLASVKKFIRENEGKLFIKFISEFDGMTDGLAFEKNPSFKTVEKTTENVDHSLGIKDAYFIGYGSRDYFNSFENEEFIGIHVYNSCGSFDIGIKK